MIEKTKSELESLKKKYESKIKDIDEKIEKIKPAVIGFKYNNKK